jgi:hypothetical protein
MDKIHLSKKTKTSRLLGALLTAIGALATQGVAHAAIVLTASPSEVTVPFGQSTGTSTITYDSGSYDKSQIWMSVDGGGQTLFKDDENHNKPDKGTKVAIVQAGKTYIFKMFRGIGNQNDPTKLLASATVVAKRPKIKLPPPGTFDFIKNVKVEPHIDFVKFTFTTPRPSLPIIAISTKAPKAPFDKFTAKGATTYSPYTTSEIVSANFAQYGTNHASELRNLQPNTTYHYVIEASDKGVGTYRETGTFTTLKRKEVVTLKRKVVVTFSSIKVTDDSDDLSQGDLAFGFFINGQNNVGGKMSFPSSGQIGWPTGDTKNINLTRTLTNAPAKLTLKVTGFDDDEFESPFTLSTCGKGAITNPNMSKNGENSCGEWTSTWKTFNLESFDAVGTHSAVPFTLTGTAGGDSELAFVVKGSYTVSYAR